VGEPCLPKCCYPDMRRSNPPCEAPGTTATIWEHQSGGGPAEDGRLNASECPLLRSVIENRPKVLTGRSQKGMRVGSSIETLDDGGTRTRRTIGRSRPIRFSTLDNRVSLTRPVAGRRRYSDRKEGDGGGGRGCRKKRRPFCNEADRAATAGIPNLKGCRLPAGLSGAMRLAASTDGDVRRRKLNRPEDGCRKLPVGRNQDRVLRVARDPSLPRRLEPDARRRCAVKNGGSNPCRRQEKLGEMLLCQPSYLMAKVYGDKSMTVKRGFWRTCQTQCPARPTRYG
jgi:hypothetical protein